MCLPRIQSSEGTGTQALTVEGPAHLLPLYVSPSREHIWREPEVGIMAILLSLHTNYCHQEKGERERARERDRCALALRPAKGSEHELCITQAIEIRVEWGKS